MGLFIIKLSGDFYRATLC